MRVKLLPPAERDLFILSEPLQDKIMEKIEMLARFPEMGPCMYDAYKNYRCVLVWKNQYKIIYKIVSSELIEIAYIRHCRRQMRLRIIN